MPTFQTSTAGEKSGQQPAPLLRYAILAVMLSAGPALGQSLTGAIDMHAHADPDGTGRSIDAIDLARLAKSRGMRGLVLKNHYEPTASLAWIVRKEVPGIEVFGGISLDLTVGGVNPAAVEWMTKVKGGYGRVVWMPTYDSEAGARRSRQPRPFARVVADGKVVPEVVQVITIIAKNNLVLETGHSSPAESLLILAEGKRQGAKHMAVTHALTSGMSIPEMKEAAALGAFIELIYAPFDDAQMQKNSQAIQEVGAEHFILSSDLGQSTTPLHPDGLLKLFRALMDHGISQTNVDLMSKTNPSILLELKP